MQDIQFDKRIYEITSVSCYGENGEKEEESPKEDQKPTPKIKNCDETSSAYATNFSGEQDPEEGQEGGETVKGESGVPSEIFDQCEGVFPEGLPRPRKPRNGKEGVRETVAGLPR